MGLHILIVGDNVPQTIFLRYYLEAEGYIVSNIARGDDAEAIIRSSIPDLIVTNWLLAGISGIELCCRLRANCETENVLTIMLTTLGEEGERIGKLTNCANDYIENPIALPKMIERISFLLRRHHQRRSSQRHDGYKLSNGGQRYALRADLELCAGSAEYRLLKFLKQRPGLVYSRIQLVAAVWGHNISIDGRTVDVHVGRLRKAAMASGEKNPVRTVRGVGYAFDST